MKIILVVAYLSYSGIPSMKLYERPNISQCRDEATAIYNKVKAGTVRAWCVKLAGDSN